MSLQEVYCGWKLVSAVVVDDNSRSQWVLVLVLRKVILSFLIIELFIPMLIFTVHSVVSSAASCSFDVSFLAASSCVVQSSTYLIMSRQVAKSLDMI